MDKLKIRRYKASDNPVVWELHWLGLAELGVKPIPSPFDQDLYDIENVYLNNGDFIVGEFRGKVIAMGAFRKIKDGMVEIKRMRVHPDYQRKGFGQKILQELEKRAKEMGYKRATLFTDIINTKAINFYKKNGYKEFKKDTLYIRNSVVKVIYYEKNLDEI